MPEREIAVTVNDVVTDKRADYQYPEGTTDEEIRSAGFTTVDFARAVASALGKVRKEEEGVGRLRIRIKDTDRVTGDVEKPGFDPVYFSNWWTSAVRTPASDPTKDGTDWIVDLSL